MQLGKRIIMGFGALIAGIILMMPFGKYFTADNPDNILRVKIGWVILGVLFVLGFIFPNIGGRLFVTSSWGREPGLTNVQNPRQNVKIRYLFLVLVLFILFLTYLVFEMRCNGIINCFK